MKSSEHTAIDRPLKTSLRTTILFFLFVFIFFVYHALPFSLQARRDAFLTSEMGKGVRDLLELREILHKFHAKYGSYPKSVGFDGFRTCWGRSAPDWIPGLVPEFLRELPRERRMSELCNTQYYYMSDGTNYKLISHEPAELTEVVSLFPEMFDPKRPYYAFGIWTREWRTK